MTAIEEINCHDRSKQDINLTSILLVDNDWVINNLLQNKLKKIVTLVEVAENIEEADILLQRCHFDLMIINVSQSDNAAVEWINSLHDKGDETGVIFMAADAVVETAIDALRAGAADFILQPFSQEQMLKAVNNFFEHKKIKRKNFVLHRQIDDMYDASGIIGDCDAINRVCRIIKRVAPMPSTVLIEGESGTGKELAARAVHHWSHRSGSFVPINCGAMSVELLESELFGHARGAFTGASQAREGLFSYANSGTLFLDEIGEMPLALQAHLLRVLDERTIRAVGSNREIPLDVRIIAATNKDLKKQVKKGIFREDLYYRLNVLAIRIPSLRERMEDIPVLANHFISTLSVELGIESPSYDKNELSQLQRYDWPGNIRELKNVIERCLLLNAAPGQCVPGLTTNKYAMNGDSSLDNKKLEYVEKQHILKVLDEESGNKSAAARVLGISRKTLERKVQLWDSR
jgi:DNA-binding NtrC family response regulator